MMKLAKSAPFERPQVADTPHGEEDNGEIEDDDELYQRKVDEGLVQYKLRPTRFNLATPFEMCTRGFVEKQKQQLQQDMTDVEQQIPAGKKQCCFCTKLIPPG
ncbi:hypothetical protein LSTR_LSTR012249 [Laodelphax striatellus]|uniref:Uncharacterized protein n=1 Tax=Laodelphax striatellus TaxID=195883 RepID=A0A482WK51_LAOST|nr:hypothetical protein LSTR_LSTR012249 [Laodelphax striatellus]